MKIREIIEEDLKPKEKKEHRFEIPEPVSKDNWNIFFHPASRYIDCKPLPDKEHPAFDMYYKLSKARYTNKCIKLMEYRDHITHELLNEKEFTEMCKWTEKEIFNMHLWFRYSQLTKTKQIIKRRAKKSEKWKPKPKKYDTSVVALEENGYRVVDTVVLDAKDKTMGTLMINGRIQLPNENRISLYQFLKESR